MNLFDEFIDEYDKKVQGKFSKTTNLLFDITMAAFFYPAGKF